MKKVNHITCCLLTCLCLWSCSNNFLNDNNKELAVSIEDPFLIYHSDSPYQTLTVNIPLAKNNNFTIRQYPQWMKFTSMENKFQEGIATLEFQLAVENDIVGTQQSGTVILDIDEVGYASFHVTYLNEGHPKIRLNPENIDFGRDQTEASFEISNTGDGNLWWKVVSKPEWISLQNLGAEEWSIPPYGNMSIHLNCNKGVLDPGSYTGEIVIESNSRGESQANNKSTSKVLVSMEVPFLVNPDNVYPIEGKVVAATFNKRHNTLYILTQSPGALITYHINQNNRLPDAQRIPLSQLPACLALSEDGNRLFIGCGGQLLQYNVPTMTLVKSIELDFIPFAMVYGENGWCYLSPNVEYSNNKIYCVNVQNEETAILPSVYAFGHMSTKVHFTKTPGVPKLLATCSSISPAGVYLFDISQAIPSQESVFQYWHEGYSNGRPFWLSEDGNLVYTGNGSVLRNPAKKTTGTDLLPINHFSQTYVEWVDPCTASHSIWKASMADRHEDSNVYQINDIDYTPIRSIKPADYMTTINQVKQFYPTCVHYLFSSKDGSSLFMVKNVDNAKVYLPDYASYINDWSLEHVSFK